MSTSTQLQPPKHKPQRRKDTLPIKATNKSQPIGLSREEVRHIIETIG